MNPAKWLRAKSGKLLRIKDTPHALAVGVAAGMFFGFVPLLGLKTLLALGVTRLFRGNLLAAAITVTLHDVLLPIAPLFLRWEYELGYWLLSDPHVLPPQLSLPQFSPSAWFHWNTFFTVGHPLLVGSIVLAMPFTAAAYYFTLRWAKRLPHNTTIPKDGPKTAPTSNEDGETNVQH